MKKIILIATGLLALAIAPAFSQGTTFAERQKEISQKEIATNVPSQLTKFNLDFPGGTPKDLVAAIEKAMGKPLNVIISDEDNSGVVLPPLKMSNVDVMQLFFALEQASVKQIETQSRFGNPSTFISGYGFKTADGKASDDSIWYFHVDKPANPPKQTSEIPKIIRFYSMERFLNRGLTVDDITTAIQTGWKMAGIKPAPELNYHKETKMLIVYAEPDKLVPLEAALNALPSSSTTVDTVMQMNNKLVDKITALQARIEKLEHVTEPLKGIMPEEKSGK